MERTYIIPLRKDFIKTAKYKRAKKAVSTVREFLSRHMKSDDIRLGNVLNEMLWKRGMKSPPGKIKVVAIKDDKGVVKAELFGHKYVEKVKIEKKEKSKLEQLKEKMMGEEKNKEAITNVPEHEGHDHTAHQHTEKEIHAEQKKERKVTRDENKSKDKR